MGAWTELVDYTVPSNTTSVVLNDFGTITKDDFIRVSFSLVNAATSTSNEISITANSTVASNYHVQNIQAFGTGIAASRTNSSVMFSVATNINTFANIYMKLSENDRFNYFSTSEYAQNSDIRIQQHYGTSSGATFPSGITSLTFTAETTNGFATGSRIQIYRLDAEKVADITVASATTQVDISSLNIGKDSEYLLVSDIANDGTAIFFSLMVNDNTTPTNYYRQRILGSGSSASAARTNSAEPANTLTSGRTIIHSHIKLSEIGAYTSQNYAIVDSGSSNISLQNNFVSSTSEAITSITKLNIRANDPNRILSGCRFILYKLK
jgi:hypothetical protein